MSRRVQCKFFADGACLKGERCEFLHNQKDPQYKVCTYYQKGICSYGSRCKFAHVKSSRWRQSASSSSSVPRRSSAADSVPIPRSSRILAPGGSVESSISTRTLSTSDKCEDMGFVHQDLSDKGKTLELDNINPEEQPICSYAAAGDCPIGELCPHIHGEACPTCGKRCLHPFRPREREKHMIICEKNQKQLEALKNSQEIECCVCMELVLAKPSPAERKFGLLTECDHSFCISCIRNWRNSSPSIGMDVNSTLRACPICRKLSYFVVPSPIWYSTPEEKAEIIDNYKTKLRSIDCKHFNFGNGNCPFGKICFYKHTVKPESYTWKYNRPPPRLPHRQPRNVDVSELFSMFEDGISEDELDPFGFADMDYYDDDDEDDFSPFDVAMLLMNLDLESDNSPSDEDYVYPF